MWSMKVAEKVISDWWTIGGVFLLFSLHFSFFIYFGVWREWCLHVPHVTKALEISFICERNRSNSFKITVKVPESRQNTRILFLFSRKNVVGSAKFSRKGHRKTTHKVSSNWNSAKSSKAKLLMTIVLLLLYTNMDWGQSWCFLSLMCLSCKIW